MSNMGRYNLLVEKLDSFIRKYYKNQLIRGSIYFSAFTLLSFLAVVLLEYFGHYNSFVRGILFYSFLGVTVFCLLRYLLVPLAHLYRFGKIISYGQASQIIGNHFSEVKDSLLNTLQLKEEADKKGADTTLLMAAIEQKMQNLRPVPFGAAINLHANLRYLKYALLPLLIYAVIFIVSPGMISDGGERLINYKQHFAPRAPFSFILKNKSLDAEQFADYEVQLKLNGTQLPNEVYIESNGQSFKMQKDDKLNFSYTFKNLQRNLDFRFEADDFFSEDYNLNVLAKPILLNYQVFCDYPSYLGKKDEVLNSPGDLNVPAGTQLNWKFLARQTDAIQLGFSSGVFTAGKDDEYHFHFSRRQLQSESYYIKKLNQRFASGDSILFNINVIPDAYPQLTVEEKIDSVSNRQVYFIGDAGDDHGLSKLSFTYRFIKSENKEKTQAAEQKKLLPLGRNQNPQRFYHYFNLAEINLQPGDELEYFFEVWDNDAVHGPKSSRSKTMLFRAPGIAELKEQTKAGSEAFKDKMEDARQEARDLQKELKELQRKMQEKPELNWEEKRKAEQLLERQKELNRKMEELQKELKHNTEKEQQYKQEEERIMEKQQELEKLYKDLMTDEMQQLMKKIEQMMKMQNKELMKNEMEKMQLNNKDVEKELDRLLEMYKQLEVEKKMEDAAKGLDELAKKQEELQQKTEGQDADNKELQQEQEKLKEEFKDLQQELKELEKLNKELEDPAEMADTKEEEKQAAEEMENSSNELGKNNKKKAANNQKKAAEKMKQMAQKMRDKQQEQESKEEEENVNNLREILENLVELSKQQEDLMGRFRKITGYNPQFVQMAQEQKNLKDNAALIQDSLQALSKRVAQVRSFINKEMTRMNESMNKANRGFAVRDFQQVSISQQTAMTHMNNLALMLSETLKQMQMDMEGKKGQKDGKPGKPSGKPGKGKGKGKLSMGELKKMQEELNRQLREGMNKQQGGQQPKPGQNNQNNMSSEQFARMAAQQMAIRQQLQKMLSEMGAKEKEGLGGSKLQEMQKMMEQTEKELFNKRLSTEMQQRQQEILTRLLESEKAERKQEQENKREAEQAKEKERSSPPPSFEKYLEQKAREQELIKTVPAEMQPYYKSKAAEYLKEAE